MSLSAERTAPRTERELTTAAAPALVESLRQALHARHGARLRTGSSLRVGATLGNGAAMAIAVAGHARRSHEVFVFARGSGDGLDGPLAACVDVLDALVGSVVGDDDAFLPLDWEGRPFERGVVFVRGEVRDYVAERQAAMLLQEEAPPPALPLDVDA